MAQIIISYRRADSQAIAGRVFDRLSAQYGERAVFMDIDAIPFGIDFRKHIGEALRRCDVLIALVGPHWLGRQDGGANRIDDPADPVRIELEGAFEQGVPVIPVLIDDARMPSEAELPPSLKQFSYFNAAPVDSGRDFRPHMDRLIRALDELLAAKGHAVAKPSAASARSPAAERAKRSGAASTSTARYVWIALAGILVLGAGALTFWMNMQRSRLDLAGGQPVNSTTGSQPQPAQATVTLKSADEHVVRMIADEIKAANVNLAVELDAAASALGIAEQWDALAKGEVDLAFFQLYSVSDKVPAFAATFMPALVPNYEHARRLGGSAFMAQIKRVAATAGVVVLADIWMSTSIISKKGCIRRPEDVRGLRVYTLGEGFEVMLRAAGATLVEAPDADIPAAFKSSADVAVTSPVLGLRVAELAKCVTIPGDYSLGLGYLPLLASKKGFERLNRTQQSVLLKVAKEAESSLADGYRNLDEYLVRMLGTSGVQTVTLSKADYDAWIKLAQASAYRDFAATVPGGKQLLDDAVAGK